MEVVLLEGLDRVQEIPLEISFPVARASIMDPYAVLLAENGEIFFLQLVEVSEGHRRLIVRQPMIHQESPATAATVYKDMSGLFCLSAGRGGQEETPTMKTEVRPQPESGLLFEQSLEAMSSSLTADDEDDLLYGTSGTTKATAFDKKPDITVFKEPAKKKPEVFFETMIPRTSSQDPNDLNPTHWVAIARENGLLEIFQLPDFKLVYMIRKFPYSYKTLMDTDPLHVPSELDRPDEHYPPVREIMIVGMGANNARPHLFVVVGDELVIYEVFPYDEGYQDHLCLRFRRLPIPAALRNVKILRGRKRHLRGDVVGDLGQSELDGFQNLLYTLDDVEGYAGVFVAGPYPYWCLMTAGGELRCHPMSYDGPIRSFAQFHNVHCRHGFIYLTSASDMRICQLPDKMDYGASCPMQKKMLGRTVHSVVYLLDSHTYAVASSLKVISM